MSPLLGKRRSRTLARWGLVAALLLQAAPALAQQPWPRLFLEQVDHASCASHMQIRTFSSLLEMEGVLVDTTPEDYRLVLDGKRGEDRPLLHGAASEPVHLGLVVQYSLGFSKALPHVLTGSRALLRDLPPGSRVSLLTFDSQVASAAAGVTVDEAVVKLGKLRLGSDDQNPALVEAMELGLHRLSLDRQTLRRFLVVVADGVNISQDEDLFRELGDEASQAGVPVMPLGFSPLDRRAPLLNLAEVAKRSHGLFRWARDEQEIEPQLANLSRQIVGQQVLTFDMPDGCQTEHRVQLAIGKHVSQPRVLGRSAQTPSTAAKLRRWGQVNLGNQWRLILGVSAGAVGLLLFGLPLAIVLALRQTGRRRNASSTGAVSVEERAPAPARTGSRSAAAPRSPPGPSPIPASMPSGPSAGSSSRPEPPPLTQPSEPPMIQAVPPIRPPEPALPVYQILCITPPWQGQALVIPLGNSRLGTAPDCALAMGQGLGISPYHLELSCGDGRLWVMDLESRSGTFVNGQAILRAELREGDQLQVGTLCFRIRKG